jgi:hypothetical protein
MYSFYYRQCSSLQLLNLEFRHSKTNLRLKEKKTPIYLYNSKKKIWISQFIREENIFDIKVK